MATTTMPMESMEVAVIVMVMVMQCWRLPHGPAAGSAPPPFTCPNACPTTVLYLSDDGAYLSDDGAFGVHLRRRAKRDGEAVVLGGGAGRGQRE
jgi:hypothetical protein